MQTMLVLDYLQQEQVDRKRLATSLWRVVTYVIAFNPRWKVSGAAILVLVGSHAPHIRFRSINSSDFYVFKTVGRSQRRGDSFIPQSHLYISSSKTSYIGASLSIYAITCIKYTFLSLNFRTGFCY
jgi:hypothetical protein